MEASSTQARLTPLMDNNVLGRLERMRLAATRRFTNRSRGEHLSSKGGSSTDFADYRDYSEGDDVRFVDWNIFSRLQRPYLKLYKHEEEMHVAILVDASDSMLFEGKLERAKQLAAAAGVMGLFGGEAVSIYSFNHSAATTLPCLPPSRGRGNLRKMLQFVEQIAGGGNRPLEQGIEAMLRRHRGRGVAVVLSDFLTFGNVRKAFNQLFSSGLEIFAMQILGPTEIDPELTGDLRLIDSETDATLDVSNIGNLLNLYHEYRNAQQAHLSALCQNHSGRFITINAQNELSTVLFDEMRRKGWVR